MQDPLDVFFDTGREVAAIPPVEFDAGEDAAGDNPAPMRAIEERAIAEDVELVRGKLKDAITNMAARVPELLEIAMMMQEPEMVDSASKMIATLSKVSTDLIGIDLRVLQESKKIKPGTPADPVAPAQPGEPQTPQEMTTAEVIALIRKDRLARTQGRPTDTVDVEVKHADSGSEA